MQAKRPKPELTCGSILEICFIAIIFTRSPAIAQISIGVVCSIVLAKKGMERRQRKR